MRSTPKTLSPEKERALFYRLETQKETVAQLESLQDRTASESARLGASRRRLRETRDHLVQANMAMVLSVAKRFTCHNVEYDDMVAAGVDKLFYCVDRFDVRRGYKLSTYTVRSLWRLFAHMNAAERKHQDNRVKCDPVAIARRTASQTCGDRDEVIDLREALKNNTADLTKMEVKILTLRFGLNNGCGLTLKKVGEQFGLTKERIRQIQRVALDKLKEAMEK